MSFQAMTWAVEQELPALQKLVLLMLANCSNHHTGQCNPSHERLAKECGMSRESVKRAISELAEKGLLEIHRKMKDGVNLPNQYVLKVGSSVGGVGSDRPEGGGTQTPGVGSDRPTKQEVEPGKETKAVERATRLPRDWQPSEEEIFFCRSKRPDLNVEDVACQFLDYWVAKAGKDGSKTDWSATWRNWVRNQRATAGPRQANFHDERAETIAVLTGRSRPRESDDRTIDVQAFRVA